MSEREKDDWVKRPAQDEEAEANLSQSDAPEDEFGQSPMPQSPEADSEVQT